jgi:hypothetical protein
VTAGDTLRFSLSTRDPDNDPLVVIPQHLPGGASFENNGFSWTPLLSQVGTHVIYFTLLDRWHGVEKIVQVTVKLRKKGKINR